MKLNLCRGQNLIEYAVLLTIVVAVFTGMQIYLKRGLQGTIKLSTDEFGTQKLPEEEEKEYGDLQPLKGRLLSSDTTTVADSQTVDNQLAGGKSEKIKEQDTTTRTGSSTYRMGFEPESIVNEEN